MRYRLAIFDFDGTLADSSAWFLRSLNHVADRFGFRRTTAEEREDLRRLPSREIIRRLAVPMWKMPAIARHLRQRAAQDIDQIRLFDGIEAALGALHGKGLTLAIVSSNDERNVRTVLGEDLAAKIGSFGCGASMFGKAAKLRRAIKASAIDPRQAICIGDETRDLEAAVAVGAATAAVTWGYAAPEALQAMRPAILLTEVADLARLAD
jgi:phosphoglycolate phosphatase